jgi:glyoxylase-like metal-dependent hydrolase (beta-lactamase superfamily II)
MRPTSLISTTCALALAFAVLACAPPTGTGDAAYELFSLTAEEAGTDRLSVYCYLIEHPSGRLLWDGGVPADIAGQEGWHEVHTALTHLDRSLADQLGDLGLGTADIDFVAFSHLHWDHVGQGAQFTDSVHLIQGPEHEAAFVPEPTVPFFDPTLYGALEHNETTLLDGDHDVFGDGRVMIKSTPGHTPGHQVLYVDLENTGPVVLSGDLYHFAANYELGRVPNFNVDVEQTRASMAALDTFLEQTGAELWIEHDALREMKLSPAFYD